MSSRCCVKPIATIIKVGTSEAGIIGLDVALRNVFISGVIDEEQIKIALLQSVKELGNYITPGTESIYKEALLREFGIFVNKTELEQKQES